MNAICFSKLGSGLIMAAFENKKDEECELRESQWNFDKHLIFFKEFDGGQQVSSIKITEASLWVRMHNLSLKACNEYIDKLVGNSIGV